MNAISILGHLGKILPLKSWIKLTGQPVIFPFYHAISDQPLPYIKHLYEAKDVKSFERDIDYLLKHYAVMDMSTFINKVTIQEKISKPVFLLSFDDGLSQIADIVAPILLKKGVPATIFLNSDFVDNKDLFYRYKASLLVEQFQTKAATRNHADYKHHFVHEAAKTKFYKSILSLHYKDSPHLNQMANDIAFSYADFLKSEQPYLRSEQVKKLIGQGFSFGSHSQNHTSYQDLTLAEQLAQTKNSSDFVQQQFDLSYRVFSFPFTDYQVSDQFFKSVKSSRIVDLSFGTAGLKKEKYDFHFQRIPMENSHFSAAEILHHAYFYYVLKAFVAKNTIIRK